MCTMTLKEVVKNYSLRRGQVYCCLLDARHLIEWGLINSSKCFCKEAYLPASSVYYSVREGCFSQQFMSANEVSHGGVLSPILFIEYVDTLFSRLESSGFGCFVGDEYLGSCVMPMISHYWLRLSPHWNQWSRYVKKLAKNLISHSMQVKLFIYTSLGNDVIVKNHPHYIWMTKPCPELKA